MVGVLVIDSANHVTYLVVDERKFNLDKVIGVLESVRVKHHYILFIQHFLRVNELVNDVLHVEPLIQLFEDKIRNSQQ